MSDPTTDQQAVLTRRINRLHILTIVSLSLNGLLIVLLLLSAIMHHHHRHHRGFGGEGFSSGCGCPDSFGGGGERFHRMHAGWGQGGDFRHGFGGGFDGRFDRDRFGGGFGRGMEDRGPDGGRPDDRAGFDRGHAFGDGDHPEGGMGMGGFGPGMHPGGMSGPGGGNPPDPAKMTDMVLAHLTQQLTLSDDQKAKIKPIISEGVGDLQKQVEALHTAMQKEVEDARAKIKPILNADQQKQFDAMHLPGEKPADKPDEH